MIKIGANSLSQSIQRNLARTTLDLSTASERLSSGQRINRAVDDAAGLSIAASLNTDSRVFGQGIRNLNDGISAVSIAEGAMNELGTIITRVEELASQAISGTYSDTQRQALQKEATALQAEWNRIVESTTFNGMQLLSGSSTRVVLQGGKGVDGTLAVQIGKEGLAGAPEGVAGGLSTVSIRADGANTGNGASDNVSVSADGRYVVFDSTSSNLVTGDSNGQRDIFIRDMTTGVTRVLTQGNGASSNASISADGRYVSFQSAATNLIPGDVNARDDIFVLDLGTGAVQLASVTTSGGQGGGNSSESFISADGRYVVYQSTSTNLVEGDTNGQVDVFLRDIQSGTTQRVSVAGTTEGDGTARYGSISADGRYVAFSSQATNLVAGDTDATADIYVRDMVTGLLKLASVSSSGQKGVGTNTRGHLSADGRFVSFQSDATNLVTGDSNGFTDVFVRDLQLGITTLASVTSDESLGNGNSLQASLSADGRYVAFYSGAANLDAGDTNGTADVFLRDTVRGTTERVSLKTDGTQGSQAFSGRIGSVSGDGRIVAFTSTSTAFTTLDANGASGDIFLKDLSDAGIQQLAGVLVSDSASAKITLDRVQTYRNELLEYRSKLGASTSRISSFVNTLSASRINYQTAAGRITDTDVADEAAKAVAATIRQQVVSSLLGQANQAPRIALNLLNNA